MNTTGFIGKLPQRGDFVSRKLPSIFSTPWNDWSEQLVSVCKELQPNNTDELWYRLPVYRFYLSSAIAGDNAWLGITMPSSDSVGRLYPFCLARNIGPRSRPTQALRQHEPFFAQLEQTIVSLFSNKLQFDHLTDALINLDAATASPSDSHEKPASIQSCDTPLSIRLRQSESSWNQATEALLSSCCSAYSIWTTSPLSRAPQETLICEAMPPAASCASLFNGDFNNGHWTHYCGEDTEDRQLLALTSQQSADSSKTSLPSVDDDGDTRPVLPKSDAVETGREADILELGDTKLHDVPWDK